MDAKQIGEVIKKARKNQKITQTQLGAAIGVGKVAIAKLLDLPRPPKDDADPNRQTVSAIEARLKPKYFCKAVAPECTISTLLHICCCECDRPCKRCENTPQKCGERERKNAANRIC